MKIKLLLTGCAAALMAAGTVWADQPTAFSLIHEGDRYIGEQSKDRVVDIHSDRSEGALTPSVWHIVYYDPDASLKAVEVKFGAGQKMDVSRPLRLLEPITGNDRVLDQAQLKVDSDRALRIASGEPVLEHVNLRTSQLWLQHGVDGPKWKVKLWAARTRDSEKQIDIGDVFISAGDGAILNADLHLDRLN